MKKIDINCDVAEGVGNEVLLLPFIGSCNIACNAHAGSVDIMSEVVELAMKYKVKIGAHPSYPDRENFGRKSISLSKEEFQESIQSQLKLLIDMLHIKGGKLHHIKPHGALYNDIAKNLGLAKRFLSTILRYKNQVRLVVPYDSEISKEAKKQGFRIICEAFADRNYNDDLSLVSRSESNAKVDNINEIEKRVSEMFFKNRITTISGRKVYMEATTFCVHSDTKNAIQIVEKLHERFNNS